MPGLDRTGPYGEGPGTGRGLGKCNPDKNRTSKNESRNEDDHERWFGRGMRWRNGRGQFRNRGAK